MGHWSTTAIIPHVIGRTKLFNGFAVDVFIILSGFAITVLVDKRPEAYGLYLTRRFLRIFPVYLFFLGVSIALAPYALEVWQSAPPQGYMQENRVEIAQASLDNFWPHAIAHVPALQGVVPPRWLPQTDYAFLGQAWSISLEWQFYLLAPFIIVALQPGVRPKVAVAILLLSPLIVMLSKVMPAGFLGANLHNFMIGILSFHFLKARFGGVAQVQFPLGRVWLFGMAFMLFLGTKGVLPYMIWLSVMVIVVLAAEGKSRIATLCSKVLQSNPLQFLGRMSYSVYLAHMLVIVLSLGVLEPLHMGAIAFSVALLAMTLAGTLLISTVTYFGIEKPFHDWGRSLGRSANQAVTA